MTLLLTNFWAPPAPPPADHVSVTLTGRASLLPIDCPESDRCKALLLARNPSAACFIEGEGVAVMRVAVERARVCDARDNVEEYEGGGSPPLRGQQTFI